MRYDTESCHHKSSQSADRLTHLPVSHQSTAGREGDSNETNQLLGDREFPAAYHHTCWEGKGREEKGIVITL